VLHEELKLREVRQLVQSHTTQTYPLSPECSSAAMAGTFV
jgi:bisphosphoglycerate-independent phosphoglycerate mutase (AlkP superfamily)